MSQINLPHHIRLGANTRRGAAKSAVVSLYGDMFAEHATWVCDAAMAHHPRQACLATHRMIAVSCRWASSRPYGEVIAILERAQRLAEAAGWQIASGVDGVIDTGTIIDDLSIVESFPADPQAYGYNAACGFTFEAEQPATAVAFSDGDVAALTVLAQQVFDLL